MKKKAIAFVLLVTGLVAMALINVCAGSVDISVGEVIRIIFVKGEVTNNYHIIWDIRLPRIIAAILLGGALSVSGFLLQTFFQNPIAGPYVLGISSGAKLVVALVMIFLLKHSIALSSFGMIAAAFVGALIAMSFILALSFKVHKMSMLVVCGIMIGYICSAITDLFVTFADDSNIVNLHNWSQGSFAGISWENIQVIVLIVFITMLLTFVMSKPIGAYVMGENYARNMGVNIVFLRVALILLSSLLTACVTAFAGPISFVGIAVPHVTKRIFKTVKPLVMIPATFTLGALITLACDGIARIAFAPTQVSVSTITAIVLAPVVIIMMGGKAGARE